MESDIDNLCRICLNESDLMDSLHDVTISEVPITKIMQKILYNVDWTTIDGSPDKICSTCLSTLQKAHELNEKCLESDIKLKEMISDEFAVKEEYLEVDDEILVDNEVEETEETHPKNSQRKHKCPQCDKYFEKPCRVLRHMKVHDSSRRPYPCEFEGCSSRFAKTEALKRHQIIHSSGMTLKINEEKSHICVVCSKEFPIQEALASHMKTHKDVLDKIEFQCSICDEKFKKLNDLTRHSKTHPENKSHQCLICHKLFSQGSHLIDHLNRHNNVRPHVCEICNKAFQQSSTLKDHMRTHSTEKPFLCNECGKSFNNPSNLRQHVKRHLNLKEFHCHLCPGQFSSKAALESHIRSHRGIRPHRCHICGSEFTKGSSLKKHIRSIHEKIKPFECDVCSMKFHASEHLKRHTRSHTGDRPYVCNIDGCKKAYAQSNDLLKHKKIHLGELVYKCTLCTESFRLQVELRDHYSVHYQKTEDNEKDNLS